MEMDAVWLSPVGRLIEGKERKALIRQGGVRFRSKLGTDPMVIWNREGCPVYAPEAGREREREERGDENKHDRANVGCLTTRNCIFQATLRVDYLERNCFFSLKSKLA